MSKRPAKAANPAAVDAWLAKLPADQSEALSRLRAQVLAAGPELIETVAYNIPMYYLGTTQLLGFAAFKEHVSIGVGSEVVESLGDALAGYDVTKGTVRFSPAKPLPAALVTRLVKASIAAHRAKPSSAASTASTASKKSSR